MKRIKVVDINMSSLRKGDIVTLYENQKEFIEKCPSKLSRGEKMDYWYLYCNNTAGVVANPNGESGIMFVGGSDLFEVIDEL